MPGSGQLRIDARINATLYDFDAAGMLQAINIVWTRPPGTAPSPLFSERAALLARLFGLPAPASPSRLEGQPEPSLLLEVYSAPK